MVAREDQQKAAGGTEDSSVSPLRTAAQAAGLLEKACAPGSGDPLRLEVVRTLAQDLKGELEALAASANAGTGAAQIEGVEGALRAADVANLAACTVPELFRTCVPEVAVAAHLAAGAARALGALVEVEIEDARGDHAQNVLKDARGAAWRARLAARQVDEFLGKAV